MPQISIIVCTRNRADVLPACLKSIEAAVAASPAIETELIVVDNGSTDPTAAELRTWQQTTSSLCCKGLFAEKRGVSYAKNCGLDQATGRILVLTDDDCRLAPDYLTELVQAYDGDIGPALRGGRVELGDTRDLPFTIKTDLEPQQFTGGNPGGFVHGCNLTMSRSVVELVGCFDTSLGPGQPIGAAEDTDFVYRAYRAGVPVLYGPSIVVIHYHGRRDLARISNYKTCTILAMAQFTQSMDFGIGDYCFMFVATSAAVYANISVVRSPTRKLDSATGKSFGIACVAQYCFGEVSDTSLSNSR